MKIYIICSGTSLNHIADSYNHFGPKEHQKKKKKNEPNSTPLQNWFQNGGESFVKMDKKNPDKLSDIGKHELSLCSHDKNVAFQEIIKSKKIFKKDGKNTILTGADVNSIESAVYLFREHTILPIPFLSKKADITAKNFLDVKKYFGPVTTNHMGNTVISQEYWKKIDKNNSKTKTSKIEWTEIEKNKGESANYKKGIEYIKDLLSKSHSDTDTIVIVADAEFIKGVYTLIHPPKFFNSKKNIQYTELKVVESASIWCINATKTEFESMTELFPQENQHVPLKKGEKNENGKANLVYGFPFKNRNYVLFNALDKIPFRYVQQYLDKSNESKSNDNITFNQR